MFILILRMNIGEIYVITNRLNQKQYIGQAMLYCRDGHGTFKKHGAKGRFIQHCNEAKRGRYKCPRLEKSIHKHGQSSFQVDVLLQCRLEDMNYYEELFINRFGTLSPSGYNLDTGGRNGRIISEETRRKMSENRQGIRHTQETRERLRTANTGNSHTNETRAKMSTTRKGKERDIANHRDLPKYISKLGSGYQVTYGFGKNRKSKKFMTKTLSMEQKLELAINYLNYFKSIQRSSVGGVGSSCEGSRYSLAP